MENTTPDQAKELIDAAFERRKDEIESLRRHDAGEKEIAAPDLAAIVEAAKRKRYDEGPVDPMEGLVCDSCQ